MADDINELKEKLAAAETEAATAKTEAATAKAEAATLREKVGPRDKTGMPIPGTFKVELETTSGKKEKKTLKFQPGYVNCRLKNGNVVISAHLMKLANGTKLTDEELQQSPALVGVSSADAEAWLTHLARIRVSFLVPA